MEVKSQRLKGRDDALSGSLNQAIDALDLARDEMSMKPAKDLFCSASNLLTTIRESTVNEANYVKLGLACADACSALRQRINRSRVDQSNHTVLEAIEQFATIVVEIQRHIVKWGKRSVISRHFHAKEDERAITVWKLNLNKIRRVFYTGPATGVDPNTSETRHEVSDAHDTLSDSHRAVSIAGFITSEAHYDVSRTHTVASDTRRDVTYPHPQVGNQFVGAGIIGSDIHHGPLKNSKDISSQNRGTHASAPEDLPSLPPRITPGPVSDVRRDIVKTRVIVSEVQRDVSDIHQMLKIRQDDNSQNRATQDSVSGELPPPPPKIFFGRDELIEEIVGFTEHPVSVALIGAGGIGKTSIALTVLHHNRIKQRFGDDRRFIRCDQFPASLSHFLRRLSKVTGAGIENPEDLASFRQFLSSKEMLIVLDNAESILDPQVPSSREIYNAIEELSQLDNVWLCITSRISTVPPNCETLEIPTLSMEAARDIFHRIYRHGRRSDQVDDVLVQLDFHPLSVTLLATVAHHNKWDIDRLTREWERRRTGVLETKYKTSLATAIELSLASPSFQGLGPDARELLGVIAFYPQGVNEYNLDRFFPTISDTADIFDNFCILSLTYRSEGFVKMLAPLRDYLSPKNPLSSPLLCMTRDYYFDRLSLSPHPDEPEFGESRWIVLEGVNVEHLFDVLTSIDPSLSVWHSCTGFMFHLCLHNPRPVVLGPKIEGLPDDHPSKPESLFHLSRLIGSTGNFVECKRLRIHLLKLCRNGGDLRSVALALMLLSEVNRKMNLHEEGIQLATEALEIYECLDDTMEHGECLIVLARSFLLDGRLDAAGEAARRAITLFPQGQFFACRCHTTLGDIYCTKGNREKAIEHLETALEIATAHDWPDQAFEVYRALTMVFYREDRFGDANAQIELAKSYTVDGTYNAALLMKLQALIWTREDRLEEAESEFSCAADAFEVVGPAAEAEECRKMLSLIRELINTSDVSSGESDFDELEENIGCCPIPSEESTQQNDEHEISSSAED